MTDAATAAAAAQSIDPHAAKAPSGQGWAYGLRTCGPNGEAYDGFRWPLEPGAVVHCPDFDPTPQCGQGLHLNPWGLGDWSLHSDDPAAVWLLVRYDPALAVDIDGGEAGGKVKVQWAIVDTVEKRAGAPRLMARIAALRHARIKAMAGPDAMTSGDRAHAATSGYRAHAATSGDSAHAATSGDRAHAATSGDRAHAATSGDSAHAATSGDRAHAATSGDRAHAATSGYRAHAATSGYSAHAATSGDRAHAATSGDRAHAATSGDSAHAATSGDRAHAATSGDRAHAATMGEASIAAALGGFGSRAKAGVGGAIVLAEHEWDDSAGKARLVAVFASKVGENGIEPDTWYELKGGKPVAVAVQP